jgi:hypothetical protein
MQEDMSLVHTAQVTVSIAALRLQQTYMRYPSVPRSYTSADEGQIHVDRGEQSETLLADLLEEVVSRHQMESSSLNKVGPLSDPSLMSPLTV